MILSKAALKVSIVCVAGFHTCICNSGTFPIEALNRSLDPEALQIGSHDLWYSNFVVQD